MKFRTEVEIAPAERKISHRADTLLLLGSCFSDEVGSRLKHDRFSVSVNPLGTLYNPLSIADAVEEHPEMLAGISVLIVTLGTARVFRSKETGRIVANCGRRPAACFTEEMLSVDDVVEAVGRIRRAAPERHIIFTVSPMRHPHPRGLHGNNLSKATLLLGLEKAGVEYFPAYEALLDDLRDYRFTAADLRHPSEEAVDYIYSLFADAYFLPEESERIEGCRAWTRLKAHRPADAEAHARTLERMRKKLQDNYGIECE